MSPSSEVEGGTQLQNLPLSCYFEIVSIFKRIDGEVVTTNLTVQKRDGDTKNKHRTFYILCES